MRAPEIIEEPPCAAEIAAAAGGITTDTARDIFRALVKAGFIVAPLEPTNSMFDAYIGALQQPAVNYKSVVANVGKARKRWKAMATAGMAVAFSRLKEKHSEKQRA